MLKPVLFASTVVGLLLAMAGSAAAQSPPPPQGPPPVGYGAEEPSHDGLFVRVYLGLGYTTSEASDAGQAVKMSGSGGAFGAALGWSVTPNLVLYGELFADVAVGPTVEFGGQSTNADDDVSAGVVGLGAGAAYYFMPVNAYVSATLSFSQLSVQDDGEEVAETDFGPGVSLMAGKDWWIGRNTALGVGAQVFFGSQPEKESDVSWSTKAIALVVSASYN